MFNTLRTKFLLPLLLGGILLSVLGSWLSYQATVEQLRSQLLQRASTLGTAIDEAIKIARNDVQIHFAVEKIIEEESGIIGITVATKDPFVIWASSFNSEVNREQMTQNMLRRIKFSLKQGVFGYQYNQKGDLEMLFPLTAVNAVDTIASNPSNHFYANQALLKSGESSNSYRFLSGQAYRGSIHLLFDWSKIQQASAGQFWFSILILLSGIVIITALSTFILYKRVLNPLDTIRAVIHQQYRGERNKRIPVLDKDEIGELGLSFNRLLNAMIESEEKFKSLSENTQDFIIRYDSEYRLLYMNPSALSLFDLSGKNIVNQTHQELGVKKEVIGFIEQKIDSVFKTGESIQADFDWEHSEKIIYLDWRLFPEYDENGSIKTVLSIARDISEFKRQQIKIQHQAYFDSLTDIPNRFLSLDRLSHLIKEAQHRHKKVAVLFLDLDNFKTINDSLGHETGDKLLIEAVQRLTREIRTGDTVGRLGGDEFIILLDNLLRPADAATIAQNLLDKFRTVFKVEGHDLMLTASMGIAIYPGDGESASDLLRNADSAMYHSKKLGRNTFSFFTRKMNREVSRKLVLEEQMHGALERREFTLVYQPKIQLDTGKIMGAEALLRWQNPVLGNVPPDEFIAIAEQTGVIIPIGQFVLKEALIEAAQWQQNLKADFNIAVNFSPRQFRDPEIVSFIEQTMKQHSIAANTLEMEITEGVLMNGHSYIDDALAALSNLGLGIAMDDFGTGYSSLSYLRNYPFNVLKIDRSFINDITTDYADRELIMAAIAMAHGLNLKVVAEGIETEEQFAYLKHLNCDYAQGYLFSKPVSAEAMTKLIELDQEIEVNF